MKFLTIMGPGWGLVTLDFLIYIDFPHKEKWQKAKLNFRPKYVYLELFLFTQTIYTSIT